MRTAKTLIRLSGCTGRSASSLDALRVAKVTWIYHVDSEDSAQTKWMHRLFRVFPRRSMGSQGHNDLSCGQRRLCSD